MLRCKIARLGEKWASSPKEPLSSWPGLSRPPTSLRQPVFDARRAYEHREGLCEGFTKQYALTQLVWYEFYEDIAAAIQRESNMKHWPRAWKVRLILALNPEWRDLYLDLNN